MAKREEGVEVFDGISDRRVATKLHEDQNALLAGRSHRGLRFVGALLLLGIGALAGWGFTRLADSSGSGVVVVPPPNLPSVNMYCSTDPNGLSIYATFMKMATRDECKSAIGTTPSGQGKATVNVMLTEQSTVEDLAPLIAKLGNLIPGEILKSNHSGLIVELSADLTLEHVQMIACDNHTASVEPDCAVEPLQTSYRQCDAACLATGVQITPSNQGLWGLDRMDAPQGRNGMYDFGGDALTALGEDVVIYVMDTGMRLDHAEYAGRAERGFASRCQSGNEADCGVTMGFEGVLGAGPGEAPTATCSGHGTFVASNAGGTTLGLAKRATFVPVMVLTCEGSGLASDSLAGINWIFQDWQRRGRPTAVVTYSISSGPGTQLDEMASALTRQGLLIVNAAGNDGEWACDRQMNTNADVLSVAATTWQDSFASFSNWGTCVQIAAPGHNVRGAEATSQTATDVQSGTSYACPYVAGFAAILRGHNPGWSPARTINEILCRATPNVLDTRGRAPNLMMLAGKAGFDKTC